MKSPSYNQNNPFDGQRSFSKCDKSVDLSRERREKKSAHFRAESHKTAAKEYEQYEPEPTVTLHSYNLGAAR